MGPLVNGYKLHRRNRFDLRCGEVAQYPNNSTKCSGIIILGGDDEYIPQKKECSNPCRNKRNNVVYLIERGTGIWEHLNFNPNFLFVSDMLNGGSNGTLSI